MIVLSAGMPRAGSGWHYNLIHDLVVASGGSDAHRIRRCYHLEGILTKVNCNISVLSLRRMSMVLIPALMGHTFTIKAHSRPTQWSRLLRDLGLMRITYIYRDPRDAMLSAYEYGQKGLARGCPNFFSHLTDFEKTLDFMLNYLRIWEAWAAERDVLLCRYEDLLTCYDSETERLLKFLSINPANPNVQKVIERYRPSTAGTTQPGLHFSKGRIGRFREAYDQTQQEIMTERFAPYLERMGYPLR